MPRKEFECLECDTPFVIKYNAGDNVIICPFCGAELQQEDANVFEEED